LSIEYFFVNAAAEPTIVDNKLKVEVVSEGVNSPSSIAFIGPNDILALEKDTGKVRRIVNAVM